MLVNPRALAATTAFVLAMTGGALWSVAHKDPPHPFEVIGGGGTGLHAATGVVTISDMATLRVRAPFTLLRVSPLHTDPGVDVVGVRAVFWGIGDRTPSGYRMTNSAAGNSCGRWPITGHGSSYPVEGLHVRPGDTSLLLVYYIRSMVPGVRGARGYRIEYRTDSGRRRKTKGESNEMLMYLYQAGTTPPKGHRYFAECDEDFWTTPLHGFPA